MDLKNKVFEGPAEKLRNWRKKPAASLQNEGAANSSSALRWPARVFVSYLPCVRRLNADDARDAVKADTNAIAAMANDARPFDLRGIDGAIPPSA